MPQVSHEPALGRRYAPRRMVVQRPEFLWREVMSFHAITVPIAGRVWEEHTRGPSRKRCSGHARGQTTPSRTLALYSHSMERWLRRNQLLPTALAASLVILTLIVAFGPGPLPVEAAFIRWIQGWTGWARDPAEFVRRTTGTSPAVLVLLIVSPALVWLYGVRALAVTAIGLLTVYGIQPGLKDLIDRARPDSAQVEVLAGWTSPAYPSGHAIGTAMVWGYLAWLVLQLTGRRWLAALLLLPIPATMFSSLVQGIHWPTDLLAGLLIGALAVWLMVQVAPTTHRRRS